MQLRNHPEMKWRGDSNWPPRWGGGYERDAIRPQGEEGILESVEIEGPDLKSSRHLRLTMRYRHVDYHAILHFDNPEFIPQLFEKLRKCNGMPLSEVGGIEIE